MRSMIAAAMLLCSGAGAWASPPALSIDIAPAAADARGNIPSLAVTITADGVTAKAGKPLLGAVKVANTLVTSIGDITDLHVADTRGALALARTDSEADAANTMAHWRAPRDVEGRVTIRYTVPIDAGRPLLNLPQYELRTGNGAFSGAGNAFLILPDDKVERTTSVRWDLSRLARGSIGASSLGVGDAVSHRPLPADAMRSSYFAAGSLGHFAGDNGFFAVWTGNPPFDTGPIMQWAGKLHDFYGHFFQDMPPGFGVFGRPNPQNPGSGIGLTDSFAFTFGPDSKPDDLKSLLAHEMLHAWVNSLDGSMDQAGGLAKSWFGEGLAVHYQRMLPWRAGLIDNQAFLTDLNETAGRYYTNIMIGVPNADVPAGFWRDTRIRVLPYDRGALYFADLDAKVRAASNGKRGADDLVRAMLAARRAGKPMDEALWRQLIHAELGDAGIRDLDAMLAGGVVLPPSDAFGRCFRRVQKPMRRFDLGFDPGSLLTRPRVVRGVKPGSAAQIAGLRDGDIITTGFSQDAMQADQQAFLTLKIERDGAPMQFRYQPRGETVQAWQWQETGACDGASTGSLTQR